MNKKYHVCLSDKQREMLQDLIRSGEAPARRISRGRILLKVDENGPSLTDDQAAEACEVCAGTVARVRRLFDTEVRHRRAWAGPLPEKARPQLRPQD